MCTPVESPPRLGYKTFPSPQKIPSLSLTMNCLPIQPEVTTDLIFSPVLELQTVMHSAPSSPGSFTQHTALKMYPPGQIHRSHIFHGPVKGRWGYKYSCFGSHWTTVSLFPTCDDSISDVSSSVLIFVLTYTLSPRGQAWSGCFPVQVYIELQESVKYPVTIPFGLSPPVFKAFNCNTSFYKPGINIVCNFIQSHGCKVESHCGFNWLFPNDE